MFIRSHPWRNSGGEWLAVTMQDVGFRGEGSPEGRRERLDQNLGSRLTRRPSWNLGQFQNALLVYKA